jgi:hypothetical protein
VKLLAVNSARAIWLVKTIFLNPKGRSLVPAIVGLAGRYKFSKLPSSESLTTQPLDMKFENGVFIGTNSEPIAVNLSIYEDGLIAETRASTEEADQFLNDALSWASEEYGLPHYSNLIVDKAYASELIVQLDLSNSIFGGKFAEFSTRLRRGISNNPKIPMEVTAFHFSPDPALTKKTAPFRIERLANVPFERNEYFSTAPVPTSEHTEILTLMERLGSTAN